MCKSPIKITVSATTAKPWPPTLNDGKHESSTEPGDKAFTTDVSPGDKVQFVAEGDLTLKSIEETVGNLFSQDPKTSNDFVGVIKGSKPGTIADYTIHYTVKNAPSNPYKQDPKLRVH